jgi:hypothetical protein
MDNKSIKMITTRIEKTCGICNQKSTQWDTVEFPYEKKSDDLGAFIKVGIDDKYHNLFFEELSYIMNINPLVLFQIIQSSNPQDDKPDLDSRTSIIERRYSHFMNLQYCPHCNYCSGDISIELSGDEIRAVKNLIEGQLYNKIIENSIFPLYARLFMCGAMINELQRDYLAAGIAYLNSAWVCDEEDLDYSIRYRAKAAEALSVFEKEDFHTSKNITMHTLLTDIYRRMGDMKNAKRIYELSVSQPKEPQIEKILNFQSLLINENDSRRYRIIDALED